MTEDRFPVWMDCDTGTDDAVAILLAHDLPEIDLQGISAVNGNTCLENAFYNTHRIVGLTGAKYPVYRGAEKPLIQEAEHAAAFHGKNGLGDVELPVPPDAVIYTEKAWDALYACAKRFPHTLRLIATGPLTNVATAFMKYPDLPALLHTVLIMGGSTRGGNVTPEAEFNFYADAAAADIVLRAGAQVVMCGLDVTMQAMLTGGDLEEIGAFGNRAGKTVHDMLQTGYRTMKAHGRDGVVQHDSCPVLFLAHPELFSGKMAGVVIETRGGISNGKSVTDLYSDKKFGFQNAFLVLNVDWHQMRGYLMNAVRSLA